MNNSDVIISVDPGQSTLGTLNPEITARIIRSRRGEERKERTCRQRLEMLFAVSGPTATGRSVGLLAVRMLFGALLIYSGMMAGGGEQLSAIAAGDFSGLPLSLPAIVEIVVGSMLCLGLLTRLTASAAAVWFAVRFGIDAAQGLLSQTWGLYALVCGLLAWFGAGRLSLDLLLRSSLHRAWRRRRRRLSDRRLSYAAYRYSSR